MSKWYIFKQEKYPYLWPRSLYPGADGWKTVEIWPNLTGKTNKFCRLSSNKHLITVSFETNCFVHRLNMAQWLPVTDWLQSKDPVQITKKKTFIYQLIFDIWLLSYRYFWINFPSPLSIIISVEWAWKKNRKEKSDNINTDSLLIWP